MWSISSYLFLGIIHFYLCAPSCVHQIPAPKLVTLKEESYFLTAFQAPWKQRQQFPA